MAEQCPYVSRCIRETRLEPDQVTAATQVLRDAIGSNITGEERIWRGTSWEATGKTCVIPLGDIPVCSIVCDGNSISEGRVCFKGVSPEEGQIGGMVTEEGVFALEYAVSEQDKCLRFLHFAHNGTVQELQEV